MLEIVHDAKHEIVHALVEDMYTLMHMVLHNLVLEVIHTSCGMYTCRNYGPDSKTVQIIYS